MGHGHSNQTPPFGRKGSKQKCFAPPVQSARRGEGSHLGMDGLVLPSTRFAPIQANPHYPSLTSRQPWLDALKGTQARLRCPCVQPTMKTLRFLSTFSKKKIKNNPLQDTSKKGFTQRRSFVRRHIHHPATVVSGLWGGVTPSEGGNRRNATRRASWVCQEEGLQKFPKKQAKLLREARIRAD